MKTKELLAALEKHYLAPGESMPGGMFVPEVGINGSHVQSRCDAVYVGFTSASGRVMIGHEIKTSRADWLRELERVDKADRWSDACHEWYIVVPGVGRGFPIVDKGEVPNGWGLMVPKTRGRRFQVVKHAAVRSSEQGFHPPWWAVRSVMSRWDTLRAQAVGDQVREAQQKMQEELTRRLNERPSEALTPQVRERLAAVELLEKTLGVTMDNYRWDAVTQSVHPEVFARALVLAGAERNLRYADNAAHGLVDVASRLLKDAEAARSSLTALRETLATAQISPATPRTP